jgi:hypothetical protein
MRNSLPLWPVHCLREFKAVGKKEGEGNAVVSDNLPLERVAAVAEDYRLARRWSLLPNRSCSE